MPRKGKQSGFVNTTPAGVPNPSQGSKKVVPAQGKGTAGFSLYDVGHAAAAGYSSLPPEGKAVVNNAAKRGIEKVKNAVVNKVESKAHSWFGSGSIHAPHSSGYALSGAPIPKPIKLDSGLKPNTYTNDFMEAVYNACIPLSINCVKLQFPTSTSNLLYKYFTNIITFELQTQAQVNVSFNIDITNNFTPSNILSAFNALVYALQVYFYYASILTYHSNPSNHNMGMIRLRTGMTAQVIEDLRLLERRLLDTPVPPKLLELLRYLSGTFYSGDAAGSPLIKLSPIAGSTTMLDLTAPSSALATLSTQTNNAVFTVMRKAVPHWKPSTLYDVPTEPFYDQNFKTIFANCPFYAYISSASTKYPTVATSSTNFTYNSFCNTLDGLAFALTAVYSTADGEFSPGLFVPLTTGSGINASSRWSYTADSTNTTYSFFPSDNSAISMRSRQDTIQANDSATGTYTTHLSGATLCQGVNADSIRETTYKAVDYLMSFDTIKVDAKNFHFGRLGGR